MEFPSTRNGTLDKEGFKYWLKETRDADRVRVSILACSDQDDDVGYLNELDQDYRNVDTTDDYMNEKGEAAKRGVTSFTMGDYVVKALLGPIFTKRYDKKDEGKKYVAPKEDDGEGDLEKCMNTCLSCSIQ